MSLLVLDAGVAAKWFLPPRDEELVLEAVHLLRRHERGEIQFVVPDLFWAEFGNIAWKAVRRQRWLLSAAQDAMRRIVTYGFPTIPCVHLLEQALAIAVENNRTVYDSLYVVLAIQSHAEMITADERLVNALGSRFPVRWLGSF